MRRWMLSLALVVMATLGLSGCVGFSDIPLRVCVPRLVVVPTVVYAGASSITLTVIDGCDVAVPDGGWVIQAAPVGQLEHAVSTIVDSPLEAGLEVALAIPEGFPPGEAFAGIENWDYSNCDASASCAGASAGFIVAEWNSVVDHCLPFELIAAPATASPGDTVVVSAEPVPCSHELQAYARQFVTYELALFAYGSAVPLQTASAQIADDGSFRAVIELDDDLPPGRAFFTVTNYFTLAPCPPNADCVAPTAEIEI